MKKAYHSLVWSVKLISENLQLYEKTLMRSMERSKQRIMNNQIIEGTEVASMVKKFFSHQFSHSKFLVDRYCERGEYSPRICE